MQSDFLTRGAHLELGMGSAWYMALLWQRLCVGLLLLALCSSELTEDTLYFSSDPDLAFDSRSLLNRTLCASKDCWNVGSQMLSLMDHTVAPCEDFYRHVCGGLGTNPEMSELDPDKRVDIKLRGQIEGIKSSPRAYLQLKIFYDSCISSGNSINENEARTVVSEVGQFHSKKSWETHKLDLTDLLAKLLEFGSAPLFDIVLDVRDDDTSRFALKFVVPMHRSLVLPDADACLLKEQPSNPHTYSECRQKENLNFIGNVAEALQALNIFPIEDSDISEDDFHATIECLEDNIISVIEKYTPFESDVRRDLALRKYSYMNITTLDEKYPLINWTKLLEYILGHNVPADSTVQVYFEYYFHMLFRHLSEVETRVLHNTLLAMFVTEVYYDIVQHRSGNREEYCLGVTKNLLMDVASSLYLQTFPSDTAEQLEQVFNQVKAALQKQISGSDWLAERSKERLAAMKVVAGGGKELLGDVRVLDRRTERLNMNKTTFLSNTINLLKRKRMLMYALYSKEATQLEPMWTYFVSPLDTTVDISYGSNEIVVPYAMLPTTRLSAVMPHFITAEMGITLANLIAHHLDFEGVFHGLNESILSRDQVERYSSMKNCVWKQVSKLDRAKVKHRRDFLQTVNDVTADQTALNMTLEAFRNDSRTNLQVSEDDSWARKGLQLFFISLAQTTCTKNTIWDSPAPVYKHIQLPPSAKINLLFNQSEDFSAAFGCASGTGMVKPVSERCLTYPAGFTNKDKQFSPLSPRAN